VALNSGKTHGSGQQSAGLTLAQYAAAKRLPDDFLRKLGARELHLGGMPAIAFPYKNSEGDETAVRFRLAMNSTEDRFRWRTGSKPVLYGLWRLPRYENARFVFLPEGESDSHTLWLHKIPALGLPGANAWKDEWAQWLDAFERIYVPIEPDKGGEAVLRWLANSKIREKVRLVRLANAKDISELYLSNPDNFVRNLKAALKSAQPWPEYAKLKNEKLAEALRAECEDIAQSRDILGDFAGQLAENGLAGESRKVQLLYLALSSRVLQKPVSVSLKGPSSAGKSHLVERVLQHFPSEAFYSVTAMSERALAYSEEPLKNRFIILAEAAALAGDFLNYLMRSLLSEGRLSYETVEKAGGKLCARRIERDVSRTCYADTDSRRFHRDSDVGVPAESPSDSTGQQPVVS
jgi:hypothetical protein